MKQHRITAQTKIAYAKKLLKELGEAKTADEAEQIGKLLVVIATEAATAQTTHLTYVERFARNFTELLPELLGEKAGN